MSTEIYVTPSLKQNQEEENIVGWFERWVLRKLGLAHGVPGRIEHPTIAEELLTFARGRSRARARGTSLDTRKRFHFFRRRRAKGEPLSPSFQVTRAVSWGKNGKGDLGTSLKGVPLKSVQLVDEALKKSEEVDDGGHGDDSLSTKKIITSPDGVAPASSLYVNSALQDVKDDDFVDISGGHKRYNRLWLRSKNPMASAGRFILEGDESLFSMGIIDESWYLLVNVVSWQKLLLINAIAEIFVIVVFASILTMIAALDGTGGSIDGNLFRKKFFLCLSTVRLSTDSVFGWEESTPSTDYEILALTLEGWLHWLLLNLFSAM